MQVHTECSKTMMRQHTDIEVIEMIIVYIAIAMSEDEDQGVNSIALCALHSGGCLLKYQDEGILAYLVQGKIPSKLVKEIEIT